MFLNASFDGTNLMSSPRLLPALALSGLLTAGFSASSHAADVTPAQAAALEGQVRGWMASLVSPALDVGARPVKAVADGDHFNVEIPAPDILGASGLMPPGLSIKLKAKPLDGGRWALDDLVLPSPLKFTMPPEQGSKATDVRPSTEISIAGLEYHAVIDPTFATASNFDTKWAGLSIVTPTSSTVSGLSTNHMTWQPATNGTIDVVSEGSSAQSVSKIISKESGVITYTYEKSHSTSRINTVSPASLAALTRSIAQLVPMMPGTKDSLNPAERVLARTAVLALADLLTGFESSQTFDGIKFTADGKSGSVAHATLGSKMGTTDGRLGLSMLVSVDGFDTPDAPTGIWRDYLPRKFVLRPRVSGVPSAGVVKLMLKVIDTDSKDMDRLKPDALALLATGPLDVALDEMSIDLGKASLSGTGTVHIASETDITGEAKITATGLEALIKRTNTDPQLAQATPVLIFLKGIGNQSGDDTVFNISFKNNKMMVNDTDLTSLIPSDKAEGPGHPGKAGKSESSDDADDADERVMDTNTDKVGKTDKTDSSSVGKGNSKSKSRN